jgi:hypothetical protein
MSRLSETIHYEVGETYVFTVHTLHDDLCDLVDPTGLHVYLKHTAGLNLTRGQELRCRVVALGQYRPKVELDEEEVRAAKDSRVTTEAVEALLDPVRGEWDGDGFVRLLLMSEMEDSTFAASCREWVERLLGSNVDLVPVCQAVTRFMEETDFLGLCNANERDTYQQRLTVAIDILNSYVRARALLDDGSAPQFVDHLLDKLDKTGYVYQPDANFRILSSLFLSDHSLVENSIGRLFDIVRRWPLAIWTKAPFNDALLRTLQLYIDGNIDRVDRGADNGRLVRNLMQALSILLLLTAQADDTTTCVPDERIILSRLCVISTYIDNYNNKGLLNVATQSLLGTSYYHPQYTLAETAGDHVAYALKRSPAAASAWPVGSDSCFLDGHVSLRVGADGITLATDDPKAKTVLPDQLGLWGHLQVVADRRAMPSLSGDITVKDSKRLWEAIEHDLTAANASRRAPQPASTQKVAATNLYGVGDTVTVNVLRVEEGDDGDILHCAFVGESRECGYLRLNDVVAYLYQVPLWVFLDGRNRPLPLKVTIVDRDADGQFRFSMIEPLKDFVCSNYNPGDNVVCSLGVMRPASSTKPFVPGISEYGESVSLRGGLDEDLQRGDLVNATYLGKAEGTFQIICQIESRAEGEVHDPMRRFHDLLLDYGAPDEEPAATTIADTPEPLSADTDMQSDTRLLDAAYVKELVRILDRMAAIDADYVRAYNYIAFARVLCQMLPDGKARADYYRGRKQLIEMLYNFAVNDTVDPTQLDRLQNEEGELFADDTPLRDKLQQLRIISYMDRQAHDDELQRLRTVTQGLTREVASLAMAYNILRENNMAQQANDIRNRIKNVLRLNGYESHLKTYGGGIESQTVEFKTSIVYPPNNDSFPDMNRQMKTILTVIAAFLNADGGTLYIGTNDSGAGVGVYDDLCYEEFHGDKDKYQRAVLDGVALTWGNSVASYVGVCWDTDNTSGKDVLVVTVTPYAPGVELDGTWVYRNGSGNRHLTKAEFEQYNARRQARQSAPQAVGEALPVPTVSTTAPASVASVASVAAAQPAVSAPSSDRHPRLQTSCRRKNVLADYEEGYLPYEALLKFMAGGKFSKITDYDYDYTTELTLPVYEEDLRDHYLLLGYEDNTVGKVPIRELMKFEDRKTYSRYDGSPLIFAAIAGNDDGLVSVTRESKSGERVMVRVDTIGRIDECRLANRGMRLANEGIAACALGYEIVPAATIELTKNVLDRDARTLGLPVATLSDELRQAVPLPKL